MGMYYESEGTDECDGDDGEVEVERRPEQDVVEDELGLVGVHVPRAAADGRSGEGTEELEVGEDADGLHADSQGQGGAQPPGHRKEGGCRARRRRLGAGGEG